MRQRGDLAAPDVDQRLLSELREDLLSPTAIAEVQNAVRRLLVELDGGHKRARAEVRRRGVELDREIQRIVDAIVTVGASEALATRLRAAELEHKTLEATLPQPRRRWRARAKSQAGIAS
ncbi:hypothetical protein [Variovorax sp. GB1P17]|uniref:hypothetical protein n=1 Tax=Variovorax sp. GB1P17 TaxID=3443740 RepID=UPI003F450BF5